MQSHAPTTCTKLQYCKLHKQCTSYEYTDKVQLKIQFLHVRNEVFFLDCQILKMKALQWFKTLAHTYPMTVSYPRKLKTSVTPVSETQILHVLKIHLFCSLFKQNMFVQQSCNYTVSIVRCCEQN